MKVVTSTTLRNNLSDSLDHVSDKDYLLVAKRGQISSALVNIDLFEDLLALVDKKLQRSIQKARQEYESGDVFTHDEVFGDL